MNGKGERINNNNGVDNHWDSLSDIPFSTGGGYKTESGIILTGEAARAKVEEDLGIERPATNVYEQLGEDTQEKTATEAQPGAVDDFINKINSATNDKEIEAAVKLGYTITSGANNLSTEEKQRAQDFMASPIFRKRQIENDIAINEKRLSGMEDTIRRSEDEYKQIRSGGLIARFTNRFKIKASRERVANARKVRENALNDIARWREELAKFDDGEEKAA